MGKHPARRSFLMGAVSTAAAGLGSAAAASTKASSHPDAALIATAAEHVRNVRAFNLHGGMSEIDDPDPLWDAYARTRDALDAAEPQTMEGVLAKIGAAKVEAWHVDGTEEPEGGPAANWAWDTVNDLLRLNGRA